MTEEILKKLADVESVEELNAVLAENDIKLEDGVTPEQFFETMQNGGDELSEEDLGNVAGGVLITTTVAMAAALGISVAVYIAKYLRKRRRR